MVGATALQVAAPSVAEQMGIPYVFAAYCPAVLPSPRHAPPVLGMLGDSPAPVMDDYSELWPLTRGDGMTRGGRSSTRVARRSVSNR
jgi:hypothetical protein